MSETALDRARAFQKTIPFITHLKMVTEALGEGTARLSQPLEPHLNNSMGTTHGGVIMTLLDVAMCTAARTLHPHSVGVVTIDMSTSFIGGGTGSRLIADARVLQDRRTMSFVEAEARNADGSLVAKSIGTVRVRYADRETTGAPAARPRALRKRTSKRRPPTSRP